MAASSLTGIFAPGSPALVESLRTLVLEPNSSVTPGESIRAEFSFSNLGGAPATGARVRFTHPQGVVHVAEADLVDDRSLVDGERFIDTAGAGVGDIDANGQCKVSCTFCVNDTIEDGTELVFQAALLTDQTPLVASNIARLVVRSRPQLQNASTLVTISAPDAPRPSTPITIRATIENSGSSSAHDLVVMLPTPEYTSYIPRSARIDGRVIPGLEGEAFDYDSSTIVSERLAPGSSVTVEYQATIDSPLPDGTRIKAVGSIGAREHTEFAISSAEIVVASPVDFDGDETGLTLLCDDAVTPGMRVPMLLRAVNSGTGNADSVTVAFDLPDGLAYAPGSASVDGQPVSDDSIAGLQFSLGSLVAGHIVEVGIAATVSVPSSGDGTLPVAASLRWRGSSGMPAQTRNFSRKLTVRVAARFNRARNYAEVDRGTANAREDVAFTVHVYNDGTAPEQNVRMRLIPGVHLDDIRISESQSDPMTYREPLPLGVVQPHQERLFTVVARIGSRVPDRSNLSLGIVLEHDGGAIDLGSATVVVRSRPQVARDGVVWERVSAEAVRPNQTAEVVIRVSNTGTDVLRDARMTLNLPSDIAVERAVDARRDRDGVFFGDIQAESTHEARLTLRLLRPVADNRKLTIEGWLHGKGVSPVQFIPLEVATFAEPQFANEAQIVSAPAEVVNSGERLYYDIRLRNDGDGPADRLLVRVVPTNLAVYVPASTTINGLAVPDDSGSSQLWSQRGLVLSEVNPGVDLRIRFEMMVMSPLAVGTPLDTRAVLEWNSGQTYAMAAPPLRVQAQPTLGETMAGSAISIARTFPSDAPAYEPPPLPEAPPSYAAPQLRMVEAPLRLIAEVIAQQALPVSAAPAPAQTPVDTAPAAPPMLYVDFTTESLSRVVAMLERSDVGGLVQHLFALRMLLPEHAVGGTPQLSAAFSTAGRALRAPLERLFVRLRMPNLTVTSRDLEDQESRLAMSALMAELALAQAPLGGSGVVPEDIVRVEGPIDLELIQSLMADLDKAPLGAVTPWLLNAHLLGDTLYRDGEPLDALGAYRNELLNVLTVLSDLPVQEFHRVLTTSVNRSLDAAIEGVLLELHGALPVVSE